ncbi:MAG: 8-amino-7-oxononanoate synthase, partial [Thiobacillus sp.]
VPAIRTPTVPADTARLRITLSAAHSAGDVDQLIGALHDIA